MPLNSSFTSVGAYPPLLWTMDISNILSTFYKVASVKKEVYSKDKRYRLLAGYQAYIFRDFVRKIMHDKYICIGTFKVGKQNSDY